jgi:hypothetical protein
MSHNHDIVLSSVAATGGLAVAMFVVACHPPKGILTPEGGLVNIVDAAPPGCAQLGDVYGSFDASDHERAIVRAKADLRNRAAAMGATDVVVDATHDSSHAQTLQGTTLGHSFNVVIEGKALRCAAQPAAAPASSGEAPQAASSSAP